MSTTDPMIDVYELLAQDIHDEFHGVYPPLARKIVEAISRL